MTDDQNKKDQNKDQNEQPTEISAPYEPSKPAASHTSQVWLGIGLLTLLHLLVLLVPIGYFAIGIVQLVYLIPALIFTRKNKGMMQGLLIGAGVTFLVNAACFGIVMGALN